MDDITGVKFNSRSVLREKNSLTASIVASRLRRVIASKGSALITSLIGSPSSLLLGLLVPAVNPCS